MKIVRTSLDWDNWYETLSVEDTLAWNQQCDQMKYYQQYSPAGGKILEGGCGNGRLVLQLASLGNDIIGIDNSPVAIANARKHNPALAVQLGDVLALEFPEDHFDAYISVGVVEHFPQGPGGVLQEAKRVLKPGGHLLIDVPVYNTLIRLFDLFPWLDLRYWLASNPRLRKLFRKPPKPVPTEFCNYLFTRDEFVSLLRQAGFEIIQVIPVQHSYGLLHSLSPCLAGLVRDKKSQWFDPRPNFWGKLLLGLHNIFPWLFPQSVFVVARKPAAMQAVLARRPEMLMSKS